MPKFWLGTHHPHWLRELDVGLMVSHRRLKDRKSLPRARVPWVLDSGGFTELSMFGEWQTTPDEYVRAVDRYADEIGQLEWAAPQDWMVEPWIVAKTGLSVLEHQRRTVENFGWLSGRGSTAFIPVLQGWQRGDYLEHVEMYDRAGIDLREQPLVGIGSVCRRGQELDILNAVDDLVDYGLNLHGFGVKRTAFNNAAGHLFASVDSMAWSYRARRSEPLAGCAHKSCSNCARFALRWRAETLLKMDRTKPFQRSFQLGEVS